MTLHAVAPDARALLYGSRARGDAREDSDWDILILIDKDRVEGGDYDAIAYPLFELGWELDEAISPVLYIRFLELASNPSLSVVHSS